MRIISTSIIDTRAQEEPDLLTTDSKDFFDPIEFRFPSTILEPSRSSTLATRLLLLLVSLHGLGLQKTSVLTLKDITIMHWFCYSRHVPSVFMVFYPQYHLEPRRKPIDRLRGMRSIY
jgi:hypothetical protein